MNSVSTDAISEKKLQNYTELTIATKQYYEYIYTFQTGTTIWNFQSYIKFDEWSYFKLTTHFTFIFIIKV